MDNPNRTPALILRIGLAFAFLYPAINAVFDPSSWVGYIPVLARGFIPDEVLLNAFGTVEAVIALWLLSGWRIFVPSLAALVILMAIVFFNVQEFPILFRDLAIAATALALAFMSASNNHEKKVGAI